MDSINDFLNQVMNNTTFEIRINIPISCKHSTYTSAASISVDPVVVPVTTPFEPNPAEPVASIGLNTSEPIFEGNLGNLRQFVENCLITPSNDTSGNRELPKELPTQPDDINVLISQLENVIITLKKILTALKQDSNQYGLIDNYLKMLDNVDNILKSLKLIRSSFSHHQ